MELLRTLELPDLVPPEPEVAWVQELRELRPESDHEWHYVLSWPRVTTTAVSELVRSVVMVKF